MTEIFTRDATRLNCAGVKRLVTEEVLAKIHQRLLVCMRKFTVKRS